MDYLGKWEQYVPKVFPEHAPANALYWTDGTVDWYVFSRALPKDTQYVAVMGGRVVSAGNDATFMSLPPEFEFIRTDAEVSLGHFYIGGVFYDTDPNAKDILRPISPRQLWLMARQVGITKAQVLATLEPAEGDTEDVLEHKEVLYIELTEPPLAGFLRDSPAAEDFRQYMGLSSEQFDDMWRMAQEI